MKTVIIKYNAGNIRSVQFALERLGVTGSVTDDHEEIMAAVEELRIPVLAREDLRGLTRFAATRSRNRPSRAVCETRAADPQESPVERATACWRFRRWLYAR